MPRSSPESAGHRRARLIRSISRASASSKVRILSTHHGSTPSKGFIREFRG